MDIHRLYTYVDCLVRERESERGVRVRERGILEFTAGSPVINICYRISETIVVYPNMDILYFSEIRNFLKINIFSLT